MTTEIRRLIAGCLFIFVSLSILAILCLPNAPYTLASTFGGAPIYPPGVAITQWDRTTTDLAAFLLSAGVLVALILFVVGIIFSCLSLFPRSPKA